MKRNIALRAAVLLFVLAFATTGIFGSTQAKYVASATGSASARVAKFSVKVNNEQIAVAAGQPFELTGELSLVGESPMGTFQGLRQPAANQWTGAHPNTIKATDGSLIAPGTGGIIVLNFVNESEVAVRFQLDSIQSTVTTTGGLTYQTTTGTSTGGSACEIQFKRVTGNAGDISAPGSGDNWGSLAYALGSDQTTALDLAPMKTPAETDRRSVCWRWLFENSRDTQDTTLGLAGTAELKVKIVVQAVQID